VRLWSLHPRCLDKSALGAVWREGLLAKAVLEGKTVGYRSHPQLNRFRKQDDPISSINMYLSVVHSEAVNRGYNYDAGKIGRILDVSPIPLHSGQLDYETGWLRLKIIGRSPSEISRLEHIAHHPIFVVVDGGIEDWERPLER
jgi:hypothetical protein